MKNSNSNSIQIYPVPSRDQVNLNLESFPWQEKHQISIEISSQTGERIKQFKATTENGVINLSINELKPGIYFVCIPEFSVVGKIVKMD